MCEATTNAVKVLSELGLGAGVDHLTYELNDTQGVDIRNTASVGGFRYETSGEHLILTLLDSHEEVEVLREFTLINYEVFPSPPVLLVIKGEDTHAEDRSVTFIFRNR